MTAALPLNQISATDAAAAIAAGKLTSEALVAACLDQIARREKDVHAWAHIDPDAALKAARSRDKEKPKTRLHGIPVGVKDVIDTHDMPTEYGSPIYKGNQPSCDAACVAQVREAGGVILGKAVSTEFATRHANKTHNPRNLEHTPGGSSSGSAAAVADCMVPIAFGTQTSSSVIRPAAFCGVIGYKPTFNLLNRAGMKFLSESLDTLGLLTRTVPDCALLVETLAGMPVTPFDAVKGLKPRIGLCRSPYWKKADKASQDNLERAATRLAQAGATVRDIELPADFDASAETQIAVSGYEFYRALSHERTRFPDLISENLMGRILAAGRVTRQQFEAGQALALRLRVMIADIMRDCDVVLTPSAPGEAPHGLASTGDPVFGLMWTLLHMPCLTLPYGSGPKGLPLGIQFVAAHGADAALFVHSEWARRALA
jgi:Asp-tRNA(Asn)/Glu-tRNA(Gln) amidotransferase A subunit family amidase